LTIPERKKEERVLYAGLAGGSILESDGVSHLIPQLNSHFICHPTEEEKTPNTPMHRPQINRMAKRTDRAQTTHIQRSKVPTKKLSKMTHLQAYCTKFRHIIRCFKSIW
jgi:hypothetical protein